MIESRINKLEAAIVPRIQSALDECEKAKPQDVRNAILQVFQDERFMAEHLPEVKVLVVASEPAVVRIEFPVLFIDAVLAEVMG